MAEILLPLIAGTLPEGYCYPASPDQFQKDILALARAKLNATFNGVVYGENTPGTSDWDKLWVRQDSSGNLIRIYTHGGYGVWVSPHPVPAGSKRRVLWVGSEAELKTEDEGVDEAITAVTGPFWEVDHGFDFKFPIGPGTNASVFDGNPATIIAPGDSGGAERVTLASNELPSHKHLMASIHTNDTASDIEKSWEDIGGSVPATLTPSNVIDVTSGNSYDRLHPYTKSETASDGRDKSHANMPPFVGVFFIKRTARQYYTVT